MKKIISQTIYLTIVCYIFISCDDSFSPKTDFVDGYSLFCVIDGNSSFQTAYLGRNYDAADLNPLNYDGEKSVQGGNITLKCGNKVYNFIDTVLTSEQSGKQYHSYYFENFSADPGPVNIKASLPGNKEIVGSIELPSNVLKLSYLSGRPINYYLPGDYVITFYDRTKVFYFIASLYINYTFGQDREEIPQRIEVPKTYINNSGIEIPSYPNLVLRKDYVYSINNIEKTIRQIAKENKSSVITIYNMTLEILEVSEELASYYLFNKWVTDNYTVKAQEQNFSNLNGGTGLIGYKFTHSYKIKFGSTWQSPIINMGYISGID